VPRGLVRAITALVKGKGSSSPDPADLARPNAWAIGNEGLMGAPHLYTDY